MALNIFLSALNLSCKFLVNLRLLFLLCWDPNRQLSRILLQHLFSRLVPNQICLWLYSRSFLSSEWGFGKRWVSFRVGAIAAGIAPRRIRLINLACCRANGLTILTAVASRILGSFIVKCCSATNRLCVIFKRNSGPLL